MHRSLRYFLKTAVICFIPLFGLSFTQFATIPLIFSLAASGWEGLVVVLLLAGAPFGGYLFLLILEKPRNWLHQAAGLTGMWVGAFLGSMTGLKIAETM